MIEIASVGFGELREEKEEGSIVKDDSWVSCPVRGSISVR